MSQKTIMLAHKKSLKKSYKHLDVKQKKIIKAIETKDFAEKELYGARGFFALAPRKNGAVDFEVMTQKELDIFKIIQKKLEKACNSLFKFTDEEVNEAKNLFNKTQFTYSQSF